MDIPRIFNIAESAHRIHNPFTPEKLATLAQRCVWKRGPECSTSAAVRGRCCALGARDYGVIGTGIDMSQLFTEQAKLLRQELGVADQVKFIHGDAAGYVSDEKVGVAACVGATWIAGKSPVLSNFWRGACAPEGSSSSASPTGGSYRRRKILSMSVLPTQSPTFSYFQSFLRLSAILATMSLKWFWLTKTVGIDTRRQNGSPLRRWLEANPGDEFAKVVRAKLTSGPERYAAYTREYLGWGVFARCRGDLLAYPVEFGNTSKVHYLNNVGVVRL